MERIAGIIPTRGGSRGLVGKCMAKVSGQTLIHHAVRQALRTVGSAYVITDDLDHAAEADRAGAHPVVVDYQVPDDALPEQQEHRAMAMFPELFEGYASVCRLFVTHPLRADRDIHRGVGLHRETGATVVSACHADFREHQELGQAGDYWAPLSADPRRPRQKVKPPAAYMVGCFYLATMESYRAHAFWPPEGIRPVFMPTIRAVDIDDAEDLHRARVLWRVRRDLDALL